MNLKKLAGVLSLVGQLFAKQPLIARQVNADFLDALKDIESSNGLVGDAGKALGPYQFHRAAWEFTRVTLTPKGSIWRAMKYSRNNCFNKTSSRYFAQLYCNWLACQIEQQGNCVATPGLIYLAYNGGLHRVCLLKHNIRLYPLSMQDKFSRFENLYQAHRLSNMGLSN